eukprot:gene11117-biopygen18368
MCIPSSIPLNMVKRGSFAKHTEGRTGTKACSLRGGGGAAGLPAVPAIIGSPVSLALVYLGVLGVLEFWGVEGIVGTSGRWPQNQGNEKGVLCSHIL